MMPPVEDLGLVSRTATDNQASVWTQESFEHDCPPGDRSPVVDNDWRFDNLCGSHLQSHLQNLPKTASDPPQQLLPWSMFREQNPSCVSAFTHQTSVFKDCLRAATDPRFGRIRIFTNSIETFLVTFGLQGGLITNQWLPRVTTQKGSSVLPISDQRVQGVCLLVNDNKIDLVVDLHTEADLGEGRVPVGGKFGLLWVKPSLPSVKVEGFFVAPESGFVVKRLLW